MKALSTEFPDLQTLTAGLTSVFRTMGRKVIVLDRQPNIHDSTFPTEIVQCRFDNGTELLLFCKYTAGRSHNAYGHRAGVAYEAAFYRHLLQPSQASTARFYGAYVDKEIGETWLILEFLDRCTRLKTCALLRHKPTEPPAICLAAHWIGRFQAAHEGCLSRAPMPSLKRYNVEYYVGWARLQHTLLVLYTRGFHGSRPFASGLKCLCRSYWSHP